MRRSCLAAARCRLPPAPPSPPPAWPQPHGRPRLVSRGCRWSPASRQAPISRRSPISHRGPTRCGSSLAPLQACLAGTRPFWMRWPRPPAERACRRRRSGRGSTAAATIGCGWHGPSCAVVCGRGGAERAAQCNETGGRARCGGPSSGRVGGRGGGCRSGRSFGRAFSHAAACLAGSRRAISNHLWPSSATHCTMMSSSARVHEVRSFLSHDARSFFSGALFRSTSLSGGPGCRAVPSLALLLPPPPPPILGAARLAALFGLGCCCSGGRIDSCSRLHRLRTASSDLPGSCAAITRHLQPSICTPWRMRSSSAKLHSLRGSAATCVRRLPVYARSSSSPLAAIAAATVRSWCTLPR